MSTYGDDGFPRTRPYATGRQSSTGGPHQSAPMAMAIPGSQRRPEAPPPLPPPRHVAVHMEEYAAGSRRPMWQWESEGSFGKNKSSPLVKDRFPKCWATSMDKGRARPQPDYPRRQSDKDAASFPRDSRNEPSSRFDEGYHSMSVGLPSMGSSLRGESQLHHQGQEKSSQAYDNKLLSKIGKPGSPPRTGSFASAESSPTSSLPFGSFGRWPASQPRSLSFPNSITSTYSDSPVKKEPGVRFNDSPRSRPVSPGTLSSGTSGHNFMEYRSPTLDHSTRSSTLESETYSPYQQRFPIPMSSIDGPRPLQKPRRSIGQSSLSNVDESAPLGSFKNTSSLSTRSVKRESYDQSIFLEPESTFRMEESVDQLHLDDRTLASGHRDSLQQYPAPPTPHLHSQRSMVGMKRKQDAMASPSEASHDGSQSALQQMAGAANQFAQNAPSHLSPNFTHHQGSVSSQSSAGLRNGSYASSAGPSVAASSYTSLDLHSPGGISPSEQQIQYQQHMAQDAHYSQSLSMDSHSRAGPYPGPQQQALDTAFVDPKPAPPRKEARKSNAPQNLSTSSFLCGCCPKKPRKFDTLEEKMQHEAEKQYSCTYCNNRFKNKNEAERHQNSLHLRRHSWSCAVLAQNYSTAFFPSYDLANPANIPGSVPGHTELAPAANDLCGYCGIEFSNEPTPDWDERTRHLDVDHKFRECNQSKKFFRADHFRQHLKHSHAGTSGKWTNRLEQACIKDEPPPRPLDQQSLSNENTPAQSAPVANMGSMNQQDMSQHSPTPLNQHMPQVQDASSSSNYPPHPSMMSQPNVGPMDMSNIDPSIGMHPMGAMAPVGNMGGMAPPPQRPQPPMQTSGGGYDELKHDTL